MKELILLGFLALLPLPPAAAETARGSESGKTDDAAHCQQHWDAYQLERRMRGLKREIAEEKAALKDNANSEKLATLMSRKEELRQELRRHHSELRGAKARLDKLEAQLDE